MKQRFRTPVTPLALKGTVSHTTPLLMLGSCFAANIGARLQRELFDVCVNPFGTLYNPASIDEAVRRLVSGAPFTDNDITVRDGICHCWHCHSSLSSSTGAEALLQSLNTKLEAATAFAARTQVAVLTFGFNRVYRLSSNGMIVANCHKFPASTFIEDNLGLDACIQYISSTVDALRRLNSGMKIILTVSPVRYTGYGLHASAIGKATLLLACESVAQSREGIIYFPSYEALNDDLRDYRFYAADMKHPSEVAVDYIYDIFAESFFDDRTVAIANKAARLSARLAHRPLCADGEALSSFRRSTLELADALSREYPEIIPQISKIIAP
ncbi:MAG: GSCFA domain-containing protein [Paramuribaculum sp.]|nr:GSCFA domain-containing protein [Paramuribaculum sp.]